METHVRNLEIQRLRAVAVIMITVAHGIFSNILPGYMLYAFYGVDLFFVISGFVVTVSFLRSAADTKHDRGSFKKLKHSLPALKSFYLRRIFRIAPLALFWALAFLFLSIYFDKMGGGGNFNEPFNVMLDIFGMISGFYNYLVSYGFPGTISHYWTLAVEMQFYAILPFLLILSPVRMRTRVILAFAGALILLPVLNTVLRHRLIELIFGQRYFNLLFGVVLALNYKRITSLNMRKPRLHFVVRTRIIKTLVTTAFILLLWSVPGLTIEWGVDPTIFSNKWGFIFAGLVSSVLVLLAARNEGYVFSLPIVGSVLTYIGSRSYSIYLCHFLFVRLRPTLLTLFDTQLPTWFKSSQSGTTLQYALIWAGMLICSEVAYRLIERPFIAIGKSYIASTIRKTRG